MKNTPVNKLRRYSPTAVEFAKLVYGGAYWSGHFTKNAEGAEAYARLNEDAKHAANLPDTSASDKATISALKAALEDIAGDLDMLPKNSPLRIHPAKARDALKRIFPATP